MENFSKSENIDSYGNVFSPNNILAYRFIDGKFYVSREINNKKVFLEYLIKGKVNFYYMRDDKGDHYYIDKENVQLTELPYEEGIKYIDNKQIYYESTKHIGFLNYYMQDAPEFKSRIQSIKKLKYQNLIELAEDYHHAVCKDDNCIIYEKKLPAITVNLEILGGIINFKTIEDLVDKNYFTGGIISHFWLPRANEKLFLRTGLIYTQLDFSGDLKNYFKIPFHIEYVHPHGFIKPRFSYGFNIYAPLYKTVSFNIGADIRLSKKAYLSLSSELESKMLFRPKSIFGYSVNIGLVNKL